MIDALLSKLRDRNTGTAEFRAASDHLANLLAATTLGKISGGAVEVQTPTGVAQGTAMPGQVLLVPIMRAALAILPAFCRLLPDSPVAMIGIERDEATAEPGVYYHKFPPRMPAQAVILDPMLATGGSATVAAQLLLDGGLPAGNIYYCGVIAAREGLDCLAGLIPAENITVAAVDPALNERKFIVPGLGDYGDRYYGT